MRTLLRIALAGSSLAVPALVQPAAAQDSIRRDPPRGVPVDERPRPDFDPVGMRAGAFRLLPQLDVAAGYDDNIFADETRSEGDYILILRPQLRLVSDWSNHALSVRAAADLGRYADNGSEDYDDYLAAVDGRLDILRGTEATGSLAYRRLHEERDDPNDVEGVEPTEFDLWTAGATLSRSLARLGGRVFADYRGYNFDDVPGPAGTIIDQDNRDRDEYELGIRAEYETSPNLAAFVQTSYNWRRYDRNADRDSDGYSVSAGAAVDFGGVTAGEVFAGYRSQDYDNALFDEISGFTFGANLLWNPTLLTSVRLTASNTVEETTDVGASAYVSSRFGVEIDHELLRNLLIGASADYATNDYKRSAREDDVHRLGVHARYLLNRNISAEASYAFSARRSNFTGQDYDRNVVLLTVTLSL